jgi:hypothetical protein
VMQRSQAGRANAGSMTAVAYKGYGPVGDSIVVLRMALEGEEKGGQCLPRYGGPQEEGANSGQETKAMCL